MDEIRICASPACVNSGDLPRLIETITVSGARVNAHVWVCDLHAAVLDADTIGLVVGTEA